MTVSMRKMSAGKGYEYLLRSVAAGDGNRSLSAPLTRYYSEVGNPPGYWLGAGLSDLAAGQVRTGDRVTEKQLQLLLGQGRDPVTGAQLGEPYRIFAKTATRIAERVAVLNPSLNDDGRTALVDAIEAQELDRGSRTATAGFDLTFSVPKSVSVLWGVADAGTQSLIVDAHHEAVADVVALLEREVAATRAGAHGLNGAVLSKSVSGVIATAYDHWDSRASDPQLHTHVIVANKVRTLDDGKWRSLDSRSLYPSVVALSEHYNAVLADKLTRAFGVAWEHRARGEKRNPAFEIVGVPNELLDAFSNRARHIEEELDRRIAAYAGAHHGRSPKSKTVVKMRAKVTVETRPPKQIYSLEHLTNDWRRRASAILRGDATAWARAMLTPRARGLLRADDVSHDDIVTVARATVGAVSEKRSTWRHWNLWAEASRQTMEWRFRSAGDREKAVEAIAEEAERVSVALTPGELALTPGVFRRTDGTSRFRPCHDVVFTSEEILAAEARLLGRAEDRTAPVVGIDVVERNAVRRGGGVDLGEDQARALATICASGRQVDLLVGPAGAGKTTAMCALLAVWTRAHGGDAVVGLAPSASAAVVLAEDLGIECENTAKWLHEYDHGRTRLHAGQLMIVDEATLAGTLMLDRLTAIAAEAGAKVLLVGDWAQLQAVDAGGAFPMLVAARTDTAELSEIRRFTNDWEKAASLGLRHGRTVAISTYARHDRIKDGEYDLMLEAAYQAWRTDLHAGRSSILVTESTDAMIELNQRARADRLLSGETRASREVALADGTRASVGDLILTRQNDRRLRQLRGGWVRNGDRWRVLDVQGDGCLIAQRLGGGLGAVVTLPAAYVTEHVDLAYAVTAHRAQGVTVDTAHVMVTGATSRENLYVSMTRGCEANTAYVALDRPDESHGTPAEDDVTAKSILFGVLRHSGAEVAAHQVLEDEHERWSSIAQLAAEYVTIAAEAQRDRWIDELLRSGLGDAQVHDLIGSDSFGPLIAELRRAEANGHDIGRLLPRIVSARSLIDADDIGAVLVVRLRHAVAGSRLTRPAPGRLIVGLVPVADGPMADEMRQALVERQELMEQRADALVTEALARRARWIRRLGPTPRGPSVGMWRAQARVVAAYRDRHGVDDDQPVRASGATDVERLDAARARRAVRAAAALADDAGGDIGLRDLEARKLA